jgi:AraC-like DNA-binding protein
MVRRSFTLRIVSGEKKMNAPYDPALVALAGADAADAPVEGFSLKPPQSFEADRISTQPRAVTQAVDFIHDNYAGGLSLSDIAAAAHLSPFHLSRIFKKATGVSPHQYLLQVRVNSARALLTAGAGERSLAEVAAAVGFADQSHLTRHFKRMLGVTPKQLRQ